MKKKLIFKKGIYRINIPFLLHEGSPWQDQIREKMEYVKDNYSFRKDAVLQFEITSYDHGSIQIIHPDTYKQ